MTAQPLRHYQIRQAIAARAGCPSASDATPPLPAGGPTSPAALTGPLINSCSADAEAPGGERAEVLDFGIAKIIGDQGASSSDGLTPMGAVMGTPRYMWPEQCQGSGHIDGKADVYTLGVLMFIMPVATRIAQHSPNMEDLFPHLPV